MLLSGRKAVGFVFYLFCLTMLMFFFFTGSLLTKNVPVFFKNFPQVTFEKGVLTAPQTPVFAPIPQTDFKIAFDAAAQVPPSAKELLDQNILAWVNKNQMYLPSANGMQQQTLPENLNFTSTPETLAKYQSAFITALRITLFISSAFVIAMTMLMNIVLSLGIVLFFNLLNRTHLPKNLLVKLALFIQGPLTTLWILWLWFNIPLFGLAQVLLCIIYTQQIFNCLREKPL